MNPVFKRRSIRKYTDQPVEEELITTLLEGAMAAPSAHNQQPWAFGVITDRGLLEKIPTFHPHAGMLQGAQAAILVCGDTRNLQSEEFWPQDCAAATQNILLTAAYHNLGSVWIGVFPKQELMEGLSKLLNMPGHLLPFSLISLGYPAKEKRPAQRYDQARIFWNGF